MREPVVRKGTQWERFDRQAVANRSVAFPDKVSPKDSLMTVQERHDSSRRPLFKTREEKMAELEAKNEDELMRMQRFNREEAIRRQYKALKVQNKRNSGFGARFGRSRVGSSIGGLKTRMSRTMKSLDRAYHTIGEKNDKFDIDHGFGSINSKGFNLSMPKFKSSGLGMKDLNMSSLDSGWGSSFFDSKGKRRRRRFNNSRYGKKGRYKKKRHRR